MQQKTTIDKEKKVKEEEDIAENVSKLVITKTLDEELSQTIKKNWKNNLVRLIINEKCDLENIFAIIESEKYELPVMRKAVIGIANELLKELEKMIMHKRVSSYRSISTGIHQMKKQEQMGKQGSAMKKSKKKEEEHDITVQKTTLKDIGRELEEREEQEKELEKVREKEQQAIQEERDRFARSYQRVFDMFAYYTRAAGDGKEDIEKLVDSVKQLGSANFTDRQMAVPRIADHPNIKLSYDALHAALRDKNIKLQVVQAFGNMGEFKIVPTLINIMKENYQSSNSFIRGEAALSIGKTVSLLNKKSKNKGSILMLKLLKKGDMEDIIEFLVPVISKDIADEKQRKNYYSKACLSWLRMMSKKVGEAKKKKMQVPVIGKNIFLSSPLSKQIKELEKLIESVL